jgi:hypothetical protein
MPALIIIDSQYLDKLTKDLIEKMGYENWVSGHYPMEGLPGDTHWPTKNELPANTLYHPIQSAEECSSEIYSWAKFQGMPASRVLAFETTHWYGNSDQPNFDNDKPGIKWEDFPGRKSASEQDDSNLAN